MATVAYIVEESKREREHEVSCRTKRMERSLPRTPSVVFRRWCGQFGPEPSDFLLIIQFFQRDLSFEGTINFRDRLQRLSSGYFPWDRSLRSRRVETTNLPLLTKLSRITCDHHEEHAEGNTRRTLFQEEVLVGSRPPVAITLAIECVNER